MISMQNSDSMPFEIVMSESLVPDRKFGGKFSVSRIAKCHKKDPGVYCYTQQCDCKTNNANLASLLKTINQEVCGNSSLCATV